MRFTSSTKHGYPKIKIDIMKTVIVELAFIWTIFNPIKSESQTIDTLLDVGGYKLHFNIIKGLGVPILFESGGGYDGSVWKDLAKRMHDSTHATIITYDRAGTGESGIDTTTINIMNEVKGLETGLSKLGYIKEIFLVAHSFGGVYSTLFSSRNKNEVKGCVFIDITLSCYMTPLKAKELTEPYNKDLMTLKEKKTGVYYLLINYQKSIELIRRTPFPANIPATVISSDSTPFKGLDSIRWKSCQRSFGELPNHRYVLAEKSGHYVYLDNPGLVAEEIIRLYRLTSAKKK